MYTSDIYSALDQAPPAFSIQDSEVTPDVQDPHETTFDSMLESLAATNSSAQSLPSDTTLVGPDGLPLPPDKPGYTNPYLKYGFKVMGNAANFGMRYGMKKGIDSYMFPGTAQRAMGGGKKRKAQHVKKPKEISSPSNKIDASIYKRSPKTKGGSKPIPKKRAPAKK